MEPIGAHCPSPCRRRLSRGVTMSSLALRWTELSIVGSPASPSLNSDRRRLRGSGDPARYHRNSRPSSRTWLTRTRCPGPALQQAFNLPAQVHEDPYRLQIPFWTGHSLATAFLAVEPDAREGKGTAGQASVRNRGAYPRPALRL